MTNDSELTVKQLDQLTIYVSTCRSRGMADDDISEALKEEGWTPAQVTLLWQALPGKQRARNTGSCITLVVVFVLIVGLVAIFSPGETMPPKEAAGDQTARSETAREQEAEARDNKTNAWVMAKQFVEDNLKSPGTADYGSVWGGTWQSAEDCVVELSPGVYRATGWVDSQNAFGATVRIDFNCKVMDLGNGKWKCLDIQMDQR